MSNPDNTIAFQCSGRKHTLTFDWNLFMGDVLEELEEHLGGEGIVAWIKRVTESGMRVRDLRARDILGMVFLARSQEEPGVTWREVAQSTAPFTFDLIPDPAPAPAPPMNPATFDLVQVPHFGGDTTTVPGVPTDGHPHS